MLATLNKSKARLFGGRIGNTMLHTRVIRPRSVPVIESLEARIALSAETTLVADFAILKEYGVLGLTGSKIDITNPKTTIGGTLGLGPSGVQNFSDGFIDGRYMIDPTTNNTHKNNVKITYGTGVIDLQPAVNAAIEASSTIASMPATQTFTSINKTQTIDCNQHVNVINANSISLSGSAVLTLKANWNDYIFFNVTGKFSMTGSSQIVLTGGITTQHVIFNILGTGEQVAFTGSSVAVGTFLANNRDISVSGATVNGVLIGAMNHKIAITSGAQVQVGVGHFDSIDLVV